MGMVLGSLPRDERGYKDEPNIFPIDLALFLFCHGSYPTDMRPKAIAVPFWSRLWLTLVCYAVTTNLLCAANEAGNASFVKLGQTYLAEDGHYHAAIGESTTAVLTLDRPYKIIGIKLKDVQGIAGFVLSPRDGNSAPSIMFGAPKFPKTDESLKASPGFSGFHRRENGSTAQSAQWRQWGDAQHVYSDTLLRIGVEGGSQNETESLHFSITANSPERRRALEDCLVLSRLVVFRPVLGDTSPLADVLKASKLDYTQWRPIHVSARELRWLNESGDEVALSFETSDRLKDFSNNMEKLRDYWRAAAKSENGGIVAADFVKSDDTSRQYALLIAKYPLPPTAGWSYQAVALLPTKWGPLKLEVRSREEGTTGTREATVLIIMTTKEKNDKLRAKITDHFRRDPYKSRYDAEARYMLSDDPRWDEDFPEHPLTKVRREINEYLTKISSGL